MDFDPAQYTAPPPAPAFDPHAYSGVSAKQKGITPEDYAQISGMAEKTLAGLSGQVPLGPLESLIGKGVSKVAQATGLSKIPEYLMSKAVGLKSVIPGQARELLDQGLMGTRGSLNKQVKAGLEQHGEKLTEAVGGLTGNIDSANVAAPIQSMSSQFMTPGGIIRDANKSALTKIANVANDVGSRGSLPASEALALKRLAQKGEGESGNLFKRTGEPTAGLESDIYRTEARGYGDQLEQLFAQQHGDVPNTVAEANKRLSALIQGQQGLEERAGSNLFSRIGKNATAAAFGTATGGPLGGVGSVLAREALSTPLAQSTMAQALSKGPEAAIKLGIRGAAINQNTKD